MPAPLAKGIIIAASVLVAAGIAIYESPQVRQWVDTSRRKIAVALHSLGDDMQPRRRTSEPSTTYDGQDARQTRREELIRRNRNELVRRAREEGVAVDLDALARMGEEAAGEGLARQGRRNRTRSFDELVGGDGMLKGESTAVKAEEEGMEMRRRHNPFSDDHANNDDGNENEINTHIPHPPNPFLYIDTSPDQSTPTLQTPYAPSQAPSTPTSPPTLIDLTPSPSTPPSTSLVGHPLPTQNTQNTSSDDSTITSEFNFDADSDSDTNADADANPAADDTHSDVFSESGFTDAGLSDAGFAAGVLTPSSWTEIGSDEGSEWGGR